MDRRKFIAASAAAAAAAAVASCGRAGGLSGAAPFTCKAGSDKMKLRYYPYELQLAHTFTVSSFSRKTTPGVQLEIDYCGHTGYGEASMPPYLGHTVNSVCSFLEKVDLSGFDGPFEMEDIMEYLDTLSSGDSPAKAAIDIALHDLLGKLLGQPLYRIWGYNPKKEKYTSYTIGIDTPEVVREKTLECAGRFRVLKVKVGLDSDEQMIRTIREVTDFPLVVDANQGWKDPHKALEEIFWLKEQGVQLVEQPLPVDMIDETAWLTEFSPLPIIADEAVQRLGDVSRLKGVYSGINIKLMKSTGLLEARKMIAAARSNAMTVMLGCMTETSCACTAVAQLSPTADFCDIDGNLLITNDLFEGVKVVDGLLRLPSGPGLGLVKKS
ncbi:MAG: dipeptide epimerase [Bacteroidales bacterium]|nr:dipeptide epimerase [Bacteroidales bacterium]